MAMTPDLIVNAMEQAKNGNMSSEAASALIANAIIDTVKELTLTYTTGLISGSPGAPVTGDMATVTVS